MKTSFTRLNQNLIARFFPMVRKSEGGGWIEDRSPSSEGSVEVPLTAASMELAVNWQSPFEGAGIESNFPGLAQMAQAGMISGILNSIGNTAFAKKYGIVTDGMEAQAEKLVGRSGVTKLNSTQVFSGMQPAKLQVTAFFRAMSDARSEVEDEIKKLQMWAVPQELAPDGVIASAMNNYQGLQSLMPSLVPRIIGVEYKNRLFMPFVIESISDPLDTPIDSYGNRISATVQMTICSLTALDRKDWASTYKQRTSM